MVKRILLLSLCLLAGCARTEEHPIPQPDPVQESISEWAKLQLAIIMVESNGNPDAVGSLDDYGLYQMRACYVEEVNRVCGTDYKHEDAFNPDKAIEIFNAMQGYYNPTKDFDTALRYHNKGQAYKKKVMDNLALIERYEIIREKLTNGH